MSVIRRLILKLQKACRSMLVFLHKKERVLVNYWILGLLTFGEIKIKTFESILGGVILGKKVERKKMVGELIIAWLMRKVKS